MDITRNFNDVSFTSHTRVIIAPFFIAPCGTLVSTHRPKLTSFPFLVVMCLTPTIKPTPPAYTFGLKGFFLLKQKKNNTQKKSIKQEVTDVSKTEVQRLVYFKRLEQERHEHHFGVANLWMDCALEKRVDEEICTDTNIIEKNDW